MQLRHLQTLVAIAECGTLTAAAGQLHKTQGAVSQDLKALESELGVELVDRSGQRAILTEAGRFLLPYAQELMQRLAEVTAHMRSFKAGEIRPINLGVLPSLAQPLLKAMVRYRDAVPDTRFRVTTDLEDPIIAALHAGDIDIGLGQPDLHEDIESVVVASESVVAVVRRDDRLAGREVRSCRSLRRSAGTQSRSSKSTITN
jgi:DNA-binding transcriptional LysR family regulator